MITVDKNKEKNVLSLNVRLSKKLIDSLEFWAIKEGRSKGSIIRQALTQYIELILHKNRFKPDVEQWLYNEDNLVKLDKALNKASDWAKRKKAKDNFSKMVEKIDKRLK